MATSIRRQVTIIVESKYFDDEGIGRTLTVMSKYPGQADIAVRTSKVSMTHNELKTLREAINAYFGEVGE